MRIAVISSSVFSVPITGYGGLEMISWECARGLARRGHQVTLIAPAGSSCPGVEVLQTLPPGSFAEEQHYGGAVLKNTNNEDVRWGGYWPKLLEFNDGGVIIDHSWQTWSAMLKIEGRLTCPILKVCHAPVNTMISSLPPEGAVSFICISDDQKAHFEALHSPRQARTCYNGVDLDHYRPLAMPRTDRFLFMARFSSIKGASIGIQQCKRAGVAADFVGDTTITGEPHYYEECRQLARDSRVVIHPGVPRGETVFYYAQAYCFLHPARHFREPFGLSPIEAQACGLPVICFDYGALRETVVHGETGWLARTEDEFGDYIKQAASTPISTTLRQRCRENAGRFSIDNMVTRYEHLCYEALDKPW